VPTSVPASKLKFHSLPAPAMARPRPMTQQQFETAYRTANVDNVSKRQMRQYVLMTIKAPRTLHPSAFGPAAPTRRHGDSGTQSDLVDPRHLLACVAGLQAEAANRMQEALGENGCQNGCQTETSPSADEQELQNSQGKVVSREGIEPSTRRLRVCCSAN
jgi:hypothetical protein